MKILDLDPEIFASESLSKLPMRRDNVPRSRGPAVAAADPKRQRLADQNGVGLPVLAPVPAHAHPLRFRPFNACFHDIAGAGHVCD